MTLAIEPLNRTETNFLNSCAETRMLVDQLASPVVTIVVDCYHVVTQGLSVADEVACARGAIGHAHTSAFPRGSNRFRTDVQAEFIARLRAANYGGGLTIEDEFTDFHQDAPPTVALFRRLLAATG